VIEKPVLTAKEMVDFLKTQSLEYRRRSLVLFKEIHDPRYVEEVKRYLVEIFSKRKKSK
jgi:hypothetical protein